MIYWVLDSESGFLAQIHNFNYKLIFYYTNGPRNQYVLIDMSLIFICVKDCQANTLIIGP